MIRTACLALLLALLPSFAVQAQPQPGPQTRHWQVQADDGLPLSVWSRLPANPRGTILLVHGRTWSSLPNFDLQVPGEPADARSVLAAFAGAGYATYALDLRGYGGTPRDRSGWNTPDRAVADVTETLQWIARRHPQLPAPTLLGYSNGARLALLVAQAHPQALSASVLYGFPDDVDAGVAQETSAAQPPRERTTAEGAASDFVVAGAFPPQVRDAYVAQALAADPVRSDWREQRQFRFRPEAVTTLPVLLIRGAHDPLATQEENAKLYARLGSEDRSWVTLPQADHVAHVEDGHAAWVGAIVDFLQRPRAAVAPVD
ncbi:alpha/beta fold hydrolase [Stenotrophomonas sp. MMGLT7]|uniref:alpha/beta hydrolase n=1 Tax=Stenotrophomonas sp. MMGLT7 TaxID=2901227 RepID=UPI001E35AE81|nr:alpha/beta fold hydrolase [Stenotrophomonas sp. MMGLT7]MCD7098096.1 alpha/beta hydrolase [Stenotrophomonas sp. MMGLT7]